MPARALVTIPLPDPFARIAEGIELEILGRIPPSGELCQLLADGKFEVLCPQLQDTIDERVLEAGSGHLRAVCNYAVGYNNVDVAAATARGIAVTNTPGVLTDATADLTMALLLAVGRRVAEGDRFVRDGQWVGWAPGLMLGTDMQNALLGIVGFGRIGQAVARRARSFGMKVAYAARDGVRVDDDLSGVAVAMPMDDLLAQADVISLHCPLNDTTRHLIDEGALAKMKTTAILINTARGPVVDEQALVRALQAKQIFGAGLDVYENEPVLAAGLAQCENAVLAPHIGSSTVKTRSAMAGLVANNLVAAARGELPPTCLNPGEFPWLGASLL